VTEGSAVERDPFGHYWLRIGSNNATMLPQKFPTSDPEKFKERIAFVRCNRAANLTVRVAYDTRKFFEP